MQEALEEAKKEAAERDAAILAAKEEVVGVETQLKQAQSTIAILETKSADAIGELRTEHQKVLNEMTEEHEKVLEYQQFVRLIVDILSCCSAANL